VLGEYTAHDIFVDLDAEHKSGGIYATNLEFATDS
jgi:hypothetical protein